MNARSLVISCEHGGREVPAAYDALFAGHEQVLDSHRGWDAGALQLATQIADEFGAALYAATTTRLLVDLNRSNGHRQLYSEFTRGMTRSEKMVILARYYRPHRDAVETAIDRRIAGGARVIHVASHSFTPVLNGVVRRADVAWLYDPKRLGELALSERWQAQLARREPELLLRRNYPYQGRSDGLASALRKRHSTSDYVGIELEVNQRFVAQGGTAWSTLRSNVIDSLAATLEEFNAEKS